LVKKVIGSPLLPTVLHQFSDLFHLVVDVKCKELPNLLSYIVSPSKGNIFFTKAFSSNTRPKLDAWSPGMGIALWLLLLNKLIILT